MTETILKKLSEIADEEIQITETYCNNSPGFGNHHRNQE